MNTLNPTQAGRYPPLALRRTTTSAQSVVGHRERGITRGMLYVDAANEAAVAMYTKLGFATDHVDRSFLGRV